MEVEYSSNFTRDLRRIRNAALRRRIDRRIAELEAASMLSEVSGVEKLKSHGGRYYRIKVGDYRLGMALEGDTVVLGQIHAPPRRLPPLPVIPRPNKPTRGHQHGCENA